MKRVLYILLLLCGPAQAQDSVYYYPDHPAVFQNGNSSVLHWMQDNLHFPDSLFADKDELLSKLAISFVVERDGRISEIRVNSSGTLQQNRYIGGIIKSMPRWNPATDDGLPVRSFVRIPINCIKYD